MLYSLIFTLSHKFNAPNLKHSNITDKARCIKGLSLLAISLTRTLEEAFPSFSAGQRVVYCDTSQPA